MYMSPLLLLLLGVYLQYTLAPKTVLYEIQIPVMDNSGKSTENARYEVESVMMETAGGFSKPEHPIMGHWRNPDTHEVVVEHMIPYHVAVSESTWGIVVRVAFGLFPDQSAIFTARLGEAYIIPHSS